MNIRELIDLKQLQKIQDQFSDATGLAAIAVDDKGEYITKGSNFTDFCMKYTRGSEEGSRRCIKCDNECTGTYFCHAGLMDFASDIIVNGERVGAIIGGQVLPKAPDTEHFRQIARELSINEDEYLKALEKVPVRSEKMIRAAADMLGNIVNQVVSLEYIKRLNTKKISVFDSEIENTTTCIVSIKDMLHSLLKIASMENILSLNASVEAARAGRAGVGFAVVAKEIGELSKNSSQIYNQLIDDIKSIEKSVTHMRDVDL